MFAGSLSVCRGGYDHGDDSVALGRDPGVLLAPVHASGLPLVHHRRPGGRQEPLRTRVSQRDAHPCRDMYVQGTACLFGRVEPVHVVNVMHVTLRPALCPHFLVLSLALPLVFVCVW